MPPHRTLALLTDFGWQDAYAGILKGAIAQVNPQLPVIDLTHQIPPQNIAAGRFCLMDACAYFPPETVFVAVVDPGVGSQRRGVGIAFERGYLVGPDNGLFGGVLSRWRGLAAVELTNPNYWRDRHPSPTFHGRDIFAPVGAHLASGVPLEDLGREIALETLVELPLPPLRQTPREIAGCIQYLDRFGNAITNIPAAAVAGKSWSVLVGTASLPRCQTYSDVPLGAAAALAGSHGWIEIAVNGGSGRERFQLDLGDEVEVVID